MNSNNPPTRKSYTSDDIKKILERVNNIKGKLDLERLTILLYDRNMNLTINNNGGFFNLKKADDETLYEIELLLYNIDKRKRKAHMKKEKNGSPKQEKYAYTPYSTDEFSDYNQQGYKLSNQEKNILKKHKYMSDTISEQEENIIYKEYDPQVLSESSDHEHSSSKNKK